MLGRRPDPGSERYELRVLAVFTFEGELVAEIINFLGDGVLGRFRRPTDDFGR